MRQEKELLLNEVKEKIDSSESMIVARYDRLPPNNSWELRHILANSSSYFEVVKKRVFVKAAEKSGIAIDETLLKGHVGVVFVGQSDAMAPAKAFIKYSDDNGSIFEVLCGQIDGKIVGGSELVALSKLPNMNEMRAILLGLFTSPMAQMLAVLELQVAALSEQKS
jgi:large subunit ribosomal protein L10